MSFKKLFAISSLCLCLLCSYVSAADPVYGWNCGSVYIAAAGNNNFLYGANKISFRFKETHNTSTLRKVHMNSWVAWNYPGTLTCFMSIQTDNAGVPSGTSIATTSWIPKIGLNSATFAPTVSLVAGNTYHIVMNSDPSTSNSTNFWSPNYVAGGPRKYYDFSSTLTTRTDENVLQWKGGPTWLTATSPAQYIPTYVLEYSDDFIVGNNVGAVGVTFFNTVYGTNYAGAEITPTSNFIVKGISMFLGSTGTGGIRNVTSPCYVKLVRTTDSVVLASKLIWPLTWIGNWQNGGLFSVDFSNTTNDPAYAPAVLTAGVKYRMYIYQGTSPTDITGTGSATMNYYIRNTFTATNVTIPINYKSLVFGDAHNVYGTTITTGGTWQVDQTAKFQVEFKLLDTPTISGIQPTTSLNTTVLTVTITGSNFAAGAAVQLTGASLATINGTTLSVADPLANSITCSFDLNGQNPGVRDIVVTNADGKTGVSIFPTNFTITAPMPTVASFTPTSVNASAVTTVRVTLTGTNYFTGTVGKLRRLDSADVDVVGTNTTISTDRTALSADFQVGVNNHAPGAWKVLVTTSGGTDSATAPTDFTINVSAMQGL